MSTCQCSMAISMLGDGCRYCQPQTYIEHLLETLEDARAAPVSEAKAQGVVMPEGWIPLTIEHEPGYPEDVAFGPKRMMDRLKKWLDRYFEMRLNAAPVQQVSVPDGFCIGAWRDALEKIAKYAPQVNCAALLADMAAHRAKGVM